MTVGQERAVRELERLSSLYPDGFEATVLNETSNGWLAAEISLRLGPMETRPGGLDFRERENFILMIPPDFPFDIPSLKVTHNRFAGFPHVNWATNICLYQSKVEWNPSDGLYGLFERFWIWLRRAALNDMDPAEGPLHPPVHIPDREMVPFVIRANTPVEAGKYWLGVVELESFPNRIELVSWNDLNGEWPDKQYLGLAIVLPDLLPVEFPERGKDFFAELIKQGIDKQRVLRDLRIAALLTPKEEHAYVVLAMPMRRSTDGKPRHHVAVWAIDPENAQRLRNAAPSSDDHSELSAVKEEMNELIYKIFELMPIKWCPVMEDRSEIVLRRDVGTPVAWFSGKNVLVLGCGALGSWAAEIITRANPSLIHLVDNSIVKPGLLARQNFRLEDIGLNKAEALAKRIQSLTSSTSIQFFRREAHSFISENPERINQYDVILDCTASAIFQMKCERDWKIYQGRTPHLISLVIDAKARHCLGVVLDQNSLGGIWDAYVKLKQRLCLDGNYKEIVSSFYSDRSVEDLFQPEPGCSDPTFSGSTADVLNLVSSALNIAVPLLESDSIPFGIAFSSLTQKVKSGAVNGVNLSSVKEVQVGQYQVRLSSNIFREAQAWVKQNNRLRSRRHETGGLLWGLWDDAVGIVWVFDASGPPPDSLHDPGHFVCGVRGTVDEYNKRSKLSHGSISFIGFWHTHPDIPSYQSHTDIEGMTGLVSIIGQNKKRSLMLIFGRTGGQPTAGVYIYESQGITGMSEMVSIGMAQIELESSIV